MNRIGECPAVAIAVLHRSGMATDCSVGLRLSANIGLRASWAIGMRLRQCLRVARQLGSLPMVRSSGDSQDGPSQASRGADPDPDPSSMTQRRIPRRMDEDHSQVTPVNDSLLDDERRQWNDVAVITHTGRLLEKLIANRDTGATPHCPRRRRKSHPVVRDLEDRWRRHRCCDGSWLRPRSVYAPRGRTPDLLSAVRVADPSTQGPFALQPVTRTPSDRFQRHSKGC